ncbi:hypothetical protein GCM10010231_02020 [Streptomyces sindenensis]|nr:hypothetical protein GCM10010231_02020 [Streptomyces sindenensis]
MPRGRAQRILPPSIRTHATVSISTDVTWSPLRHHSAPLAAPFRRGLPHPGRAGPYRPGRRHAECERGEPGAYAPP